MKHIVIVKFGSFIGVKSQRLRVVVKDKDGESETQYPLNRLKTINIAKRGVSISSDLICALSSRGIKLFISDYKGPVSTLNSINNHGNVMLKIKQATIPYSLRLSLAKQFMFGKIKNQRATLLYLNKNDKNQQVNYACDEIKQILSLVENTFTLEELMGVEGSAANIYFSTLKNNGLFPSSFILREGRGATEITNSMLNFGYAILSTYAMNAILNCGLEPYIGIFHSQRYGRLSLVQDIIEEYRSWVVDRVVSKLKHTASDSNELSTEIKQALISNIQHTFQTKYLYKNKKIALEHILQRQLYKLSGAIVNNTQYKPYLFKW
ncbi:MAG: type II CRISPR-associated endonuclease Cas1 [Methylacidiphilales bacterium]|nr:type II CRISPR-associated endonuclease Cas1 [Candidatus Methylacidiphilales bacterium]